MSKVAKASAKKKRNGYKLPDPLPQGEILEDIFKKKWKLGSSIGKGGFGEIYAAQELNSTSRSNTFPYVIKIEPHQSGPLFVEMHFFMRNAKKTDIDMFMASKKLTSLGMPIYCGSGSHDHGDVKYRFVVMERFGSDIWKIFLENKRKFNPVAVYKIGIQILDVLEYIHSKGYVHADIKGANILLSLKNKNQVYLVDFGLAVHYYTGDKFKPDPKKAHDDTIEYLSRDAHQGVQTRRGDLEILIYNLIQWLGCTLPWEKDIKDPMVVKASKERYMNDILLFMETCFQEEKPPDAILELLRYHKTLDFNSEIDYSKVRKILEEGLQSAGGTLSTPLKFKYTKSPVKRKNNLETPLSGKKKKISRRTLIDSCTDDSDKREHLDKDSDEEMEVNDVPEEIKNDTPKKRSRKPKIRKTEDVDGSNVDGGSNGVVYTAEMERIMQKMQKSKRGKTTKKTRVVKKQDSEETTTPQSGPSTSIMPVRPRSKPRQVINKDSNESKDCISNSEDHKISLLYKKEAVQVSVQIDCAQL